MSESIVQLVISGLSVIVWGMTAYLFKDLKSELQDFKHLLNKVLLEHTVLQTNYSLSVKDIDALHARIKSIEKDLMLTRERNHDISNCIDTLWGYALKNGWTMLPSDPPYRNKN